MFLTEKATETLIYPLVAISVETSVQSIQPPLNKIL